MLLRVEAMVLRTIPYGETSLIATLFSREKGKIGVLAKGARTARNRLGAALQVLSHVQAVLYDKPTRRLRLVKECAHVTLRIDTSRHLMKLAAAMRIAELTYALTEDEAEHSELFDLLVYILDALNEGTPASSTALLLYFQAQLAAALGFAPAFEREQVLAVTERGGQLILESGLIIPDREGRQGAMPASRDALRAFAILHRAELVHVQALDSAVLAQTSPLVESYLRYHVGDAWPSKGAGIVQQLQRSMATS